MVDDAGTLIDILTRDTYDYVSDVCPVCNKLWSQTERFARHNQELEKENEELKQTMKKVAELLSDEVDLFSDKAIEHDICAYMELRELDNKDAFYMAKATKTAIKMLKGDVE